MLESCNLSEYFEAGIDLFIRFKPVMPVAVFIMCTFLSMALGSSWAMYAIAFPLVLSLIRVMGLNPAMFTGIMAGAGIAGEQLCMYTSSSMDVGSAIGCNPDTVFKIRITYSIAITIASAAGYALIGLFI
ncbi:MAG: hypothetical protein K6E68_05740, partial [Lachnospiraceae bacterium]|nr:hypothetical protein [Lachnospiraceae bacterium]